MSAVKSARAEAAGSVVDAARRLYDRGINTSLSGNVSALLPDGKMLITPSRLDKPRLAPDELSLVDVKSEEHLEGPPPSSEFHVHTRIYQGMTSIEASAVVHPHPQYSLALVDEMGRDAFIRVLSDPENGNSEKFDSYIVKLTSLPWQTAGTIELGIAVAEAIKTGSTVVIMENHGTVGIGNSMHAALNRVEVLEDLAKILYMKTLFRGIREGTINLPS